MKLPSKVQDLMRRYQDFRQYAATAHDQGSTDSLRRLAKRFEAEAKREAAQQDRAGGAAQSVDGADDDYATLIGNCQRCHLCSEKPCAGASCSCVPSRKIYQAFVWVAAQHTWHSMFVCRVMHSPGQLAHTS